MGAEHPGPRIGEVTQVMNHPSAILRGKVLTLPILKIPERATQIEAATAAAMRQAHPRAHVLVTLSEVNETLPRVLTVSGLRQRTLHQWKSIVAPAMEAAGVTADWEKALVLMATSDTARDD